MMNIQTYGYFRVGTASPILKIANPSFNIEEIYKLCVSAEKEHIKVLVFPELSVTGYTCADLFHQTRLLHDAEKALAKLLLQTKQMDMVIAVGMPVKTDNQLFNCAVVLQRGNLLGAVPKTFIPNYSEFYEKRWFSSGSNKYSDTVKLCGQNVPLDSNLLFQEEDSELCIGVEICEDLWAPIPPSSYHTVYGANIILNLSASNELVGKKEYREALIRQQSARCITGYLYASAGQSESTTDVVFGGHCLIAENGSLLEDTRFSMASTLLFADLDLQKLLNDRRKNNSFMGSKEDKKYRKIYFQLDRYAVETLKRKIDPFPFVPGQKEERDIRCQEIFEIQSSGLAQRLLKSGTKKTVVGISGGLDSTLALLVCLETFRKLNLPPANIIGITMPGFGTTDRTYANALSLLKELGVTGREIPIAQATLQHFHDIGQDPDSHDVVYENAQARERTQILMDTANKEKALVVGTGDLSELALGWCTYNGDHMSMYAVNTSIPKTLVRYLVLWYSDITENPRIAAALKDILATPVSPELLPPDAQGAIEQKTEDIIGPYLLHDFFLYNMIRNGYSPAKIFFLAKIAFQNQYEEGTIRRWLQVFYKRFFTQQFKRSCLPDGPKVGSICLSPRGDWRMPSDADYTQWTDVKNI
jgi:NAD+ synthase (glutamine-hydrolysing)